ncbi:hypothetical protein Zm00014a_028068 [Zea mays]
MVSIT